MGKSVQKSDPNQFVIMTIYDNMLYKNINYVARYYLFSINLIQIRFANVLYND